MRTIKRKTDEVGTRGQNKGETGRQEGRGRKQQKGENANDRLPGLK
jgi:hypothetical protein